MTREEVEKHQIEHILQVCRGNVSKAEAMLEINRVTVHHEIKKYGLKQE